MDSRKRVLPLKTPVGGKQITVHATRPDDQGLQISLLNSASKVIFLGRGWRSSIFHPWPGVITHVEDHLGNPF